MAGGHKKASREVICRMKPSEKNIDQLKPGKTALVVVDVQNDFRHSDGPLGKRGNQPLPHRGGQSISRGCEGDADMPPDTWRAEFYAVEAQTGDSIATKHHLNGFVGADQNLVLRARGIETLVMTGRASNACVEMKARGGFNFDCRIIFVEDCCGAFSTEKHAQPSQIRANTSESWLIHEKPQAVKAASVMDVGRKIVS